MWSKINREKALALIAEGRMRPAGLAEVERARRDGRWERAYDSPARAAMHPELQAALNTSAGAKSFFATLNKANRYAISWRVQTAATTEGRKKRIAQCVAMLERGEMFHPK